MPNSFLRAAVLPLCTAVALLVSPITAWAVPGPPTVQPLTVTAPSSHTTAFTLTADSTYDATLTFAIGAQPAHGSVALTPGTLACTYPGGAARCTQEATYTSAASYLGSDQFTYVASDQAGQASEPATVQVQVTGSAPTVPAAWSVVAGSTATIPLSTLTTTATVSVDGGATSPLDVAPGTGPARGTSSITVRYEAAGQHAVTVTNDDATGTVSRSFTLTVTAPAPPTATPPTPTKPSDPVVTGTSTVTAPPGVRGSVVAPGLSFSVLDGAISLTIGGYPVVSYGQFGFTGFVVPPIVVPAPTTLTFSPPPAFNQRPLSSARLQVTAPTGQAPSATATADLQLTYPPATYCQSTTMGAVDCVVRASTPRTPVDPELFFLGADGQLHEVVSSTRTGGGTRVDVKASSIGVTLDATSTPTLASLSRATSFVVLPRRPRSSQLTAANVLRGTVRGWPTRRTTIDTGAQVACPVLARRACVVRVTATTVRRGITKFAGGRMMRLRPGRSAHVTFAVAPVGRWRLAGSGLRATVRVVASAQVGAGTQRSARTFGVRATV